MIPPFVGAVAFQQILGRSGTLNLFLAETFGMTLSIMEGLTGVVLVQSLHYFPFIMLNTAAALAGLDRSLEEAAQNLGAHVGDPPTPARAHSDGSPTVALTTEGSATRLRLRPA